MKYLEPNRRQRRTRTTTNPHTSRIVPERRDPWPRMRVKHARQNRFCFDILRKRREGDTAKRTELSSGIALEFAVPPTRPVSVFAPFTKYAKIALEGR